LRDTDSCVSIAFFHIEFPINCSLLLTLFIFGFYRFAKLIILATFLVLMGLSIPLLSFILSWPLVFVIFCCCCCSLQCELYPFVSFVMQAWWTWTALGYPCPRSPYFSIKIKDSFAGYIILSWHLFSQGLSYRAPCFLSFFSVCTERAEVILIYLPLYVTWHFSLAAFSILSLFSSLGILIIMWCGVLLCGHVYLEFEMPPVHQCLYNLIDLGYFLLFHWIGFIWL
jgi:hypothetical protein